MFLVSSFFLLSSSTKLARGCTYAGGHCQQVWLNTQMDITSSQGSSPQRPCSLQPPWSAPVSPVSCPSGRLSRRRLGCGTRWGRASWRRWQTWPWRAQPSARGRAPGRSCRPGQSPCSPSARIWRREFWNWMPELSQGKVASIAPPSLLTLHVQFLCKYQDTTNLRFYALSFQNTNKVIIAVNDFAWIAYK